MPHSAELVASAKAAINEVSDVAALDNVRVEYLSKKGHLTLQMAIPRELSPEERSAAGTATNEARGQVQQALNVHKADLEGAALNTRLVAETTDVSLPRRRIENGDLHLVICTTDRTENFSGELGSIVAAGPEIEDDYHNLDTLDIPGHHPVCADHDTLWFDITRLLRTQTSGVQTRAMENQQPPIHITTSGRVYHSDCDQTHTPMFHQMEGPIVDRNISFTSLKETLHDFLDNPFEEDLQIRFCLSYSPFTEPSAKVGTVGKNGKWPEVLGCGMVRPDVLRNVSIDPEAYSGFTFGMRMERLTMLRYGVIDLCVFFENGPRFLEQLK